MNRENKAYQWKVDMPYFFNKNNLNNIKKIIKLIKSGGKRWRMEK